MVRSKKKEKKRAVKALKRALNVRGGFIRPGVGKTVSDFAKSYMKSEIDKMARKVGGMTLESVAKAVRDAKAPDVYEIGKTAVGVAVSAAQEHLSGNKGKLPFIQTDSTRTGASTSDVGNLSQKQYFSKFEIGQPTSRIIKQLARTNGTTKHLLMDTITNPTYQPGTANRDHLQLRAGFNQKLIAMPTDVGNVRVVDLWNRYSLSSWATAQTKLETTYGMSLAFGRKVKILNTGKFFKAKVTIKLYTSSTALNLRALFGNSLHTEAQLTAGTVDQGKYPFRYQFSGPKGTSEVMQYALVDPDSSLAYSPEWQRNTTFVKSFSKVLAPGEMWTYTERHNLGAGIILDHLDASNLTDRVSPAGYLMTIEAHGMPCVAEYAGNGNENFIGTSPVFLQTEWQTYHEYVNRSNSGEADSFNTSPSLGGVNVADPAIRTFAKTNTTSLTAKKYNVNIEDVSPTYTTVGGKVFIPVMTDKTLKYAAAQDTNPAST